MAVKNSEQPIELQDFLIWNTNLFPIVGNKN